MMSRFSSIAQKSALAAAFFALTSCATSAHFYSKTGKHFDPIVRQAVICNEREADVVARAGGEPIGSIAAKGLALNATEDDVIEKAARVAGESGGTHVVLTERGVETFTYYHPETHEQQCDSTDNGVRCTEVDHPATESTVEHPTARFVVLRLPPERWASVPASLRPVAE